LSLKEQKMKLELFRIAAYSGPNHNTDLFASAMNVSRSHAEKLHNIYAKMDAVVSTTITSLDGGTFIIRDGLKNERII
tara:strand:+ start:1667 stop:1900 length:234 start_codon:yes stop_codon:yes gene_type:complete